jgi:hypothetical protein
MSRFKLNVIPDLTAGNILQMATVLVTAIIFFIKLDARMNRQEERESEDRALLAETVKAVARIAEGVLVDRSRLEDHLKRRLDVAPPVRAPKP